MALTKEQLAQLAELERLRDEPDPEPNDDDTGDDGHVIVLRGSRADSFLESLLGPAKPPRKAASAGNARSRPAKAQGKGAGAVDDEDQGDDDPEGGAPDPEPPRSNRYFR